MHFWNISNQRGVRPRTLSRWNPFVHFWQRAGWRLLRGLRHSIVKDAVNSPPTSSQWDCGVSVFVVARRR
jgi:hypothetical protein